MQSLQNHIETLLSEEIQKIVISKPGSKSAQVKKIVVTPMNGGFQSAKYTQKQVFHENLSREELPDFCLRQMESGFGQLNLWTREKEYSLLLSKKGKVTLNQIRGAGRQSAPASHNRQKNYLLPEGTVIPPLVDMGVFTPEGRVVQSMYDKYRQINRFLEIIDDAVRQQNLKKLHVIDFGCGKSYLTFVLYYYLTQVRNIEAEIIGLDLKEDVIAKCNAAAEKYGYQGLKFLLGDINGFRCPFPVDMVITLHACDTATDYALYNAVTWGAKMIFSVPCCQHELNSQVQTQELSLLTRYGIVQERFSALLTDSIRANLLEYAGYRTQLLEFIDFEHTPKNILIRAVRRPTLPRKTALPYLQEVQRAMAQFSVEPTLYKLLASEEE